MTDIPGWPWRPDLCPADLHYGEYLQDDLVHPHPLFSRPPGEITKILHVGTGLHHHIGLLLGARGWGVHGLTVSQAEVKAYEALTNRPPSYHVVLHDVRGHGLGAIYAANPVDSMSLFHLGEPPAWIEGMLNEREVIECALTWSREVVFYTGSAAWNRIAPLIHDIKGDGKMEYVATYKSLVAYKPTHG